MTPIELRWTPTAADLSDALAARPRAPLSPAIRYGTALGLLVAGAGLAAVEATTPALVCAILAVCVVVIRPSARSRPPGRALATRRAYEPTEAVAAADGLRVGADARPWSAYTGVVETDRSFVLLGPRRNGVPMLTYLPKRAAPDVDQLRALLDSAVRPR